MNNQIIPIFYACDDAFVKYTIVSLSSMIKNASKDRKYHVHILNTNISVEMKKKVFDLGTEEFEISFDDVSDYLTSIADKMPLRHYYSKTTYFRFFIAEMFPQYDKAIYIDSDTVVQGDISKLYDTDIRDRYLGACHEQAMVQVDVYGTYCEKVVGVSRHEFFNAGMMLINCEEFRKHAVLDKFINYLHVYNFIVTQDEDYLNLICKDRVYWLDQRWNTEMFGEIGYPLEEAYILHYIMVNKPWHYENCMGADIFWKYAKDTSVCGNLEEELKNYTDEEKQRDSASADHLYQMAIDETNKEDNFLNVLNKTKRAQDRVEIVKKIEEYERDGRFIEDVEEDPPSRVLMPDEVDYLRKKTSSKLKQAHAYHLAKKFLYKILKEELMIIKGVKGIEHFKNLESGAIVTCNHFNAFDSFAIHVAYLKALHKKRKFYRVIREGNYTSFPGFYGYLMRNFYTLPLSSNKKTMKQFLNATNTLLQEGNFVLFYPEQSMWWNYRKPKPLQKGAYIFAAKNNVPVLPCFITMRDSDKIGEDGYPIQEYTIHISEPIYPDSSKKYSENVEYLLQENERVWKEIYEKEYGIPLVYTTKA